LNENVKRRVPTILVVKPEKGDSLALSKEAVGAIGNAGFKMEEVNRSDISKRLQDRQPVDIIFFCNFTVGLTTVEDYFDFIPAQTKVAVIVDEKTEGYAATVGRIDMRLGGKENLNDFIAKLKQLVPAPQSTNT
jgi:hypothetical protein